MKIFTHSTNFDFIGKRYIFLLLSAFLLGLSAYYWVTLGERKYGVDFRGGTELLVKFNEDVPIEDLRQAFENGGFHEPTVQAFEGSAREFSVRLADDQSHKEGKEQVQGILKSVRPSGYTVQKEEFVGPVIGEQLRRSALWAMSLSLLAMFVYVTVRFEWRFSLGAIIALFHDAIIAVGLCLATGRPISAEILAAFLTIVGYSMNDTIIVFDRIRENIVKWRKTASKKEAEREGTRSWIIEIMNQSINETLSRTLLTSLTAFFVVFTLFLLGGGAVVDLAFSLMVGVVVGTYSSIFIACPMVLALERRG